MNIDDLTLMALADDELDPDQARAVTERIATDPEAQVRLAMFRATRARLQALRQDPPASAADAALIARLLASAKETATGGTAGGDMAAGGTAPTTGGVRSAVTGIAPSSDKAPDAPRRWPANLNRAPWAAAAAGLVAVIVAAGWLLPRTPSDPAGDPALQAALGDLPSGDGRLLPDGSDLTVIGSFATDGGALCREIETDRDGRRRLAVLCRDGASQPFRERFALDLDAATGYQPASGEIEALDAFLDGLGAGPALTPDDEAAALRR